jgi:integrase
VAGKTEKPNHEGEEGNMRRPKKLPRGVFLRNHDYWIRFADATGKIRREKVGPFLEQAKKAVEKRRSDVREGRFFPDRLRQRVVLFSEIARDFLAHSKREKRSYGHDVSRSETLLRVWRDCPLSDLSPGRMERDLAECAEQEEWTPATYNRHRALASGMFSLAIRNGKTTANPVRGTKHRMENNARVRYLTDEEEIRLIAEVRKTCPELEAQIIVAMHSGMRRSEQYVTPDCPDGGLKWQHIDFRSRVITLPRSKHGESRHIKMNSLVQETLRQVGTTASCSSYVFPGDAPDKLFPKLCKQAEVADFTWHCLRHTFASRLVMKGVDLRTVQELMGHKSIVTTMRYAHLAPQHQAEAVERLVGPFTGGATSTAIGTKPSASPGTVTFDAA